MRLEDLPGLPRESRSFCAKLLGAPPRGAEELRGLVREHVAHMEAVAASGAFVDLALARRIASALDAFLAEPRSDGPDRRAALQLAALYFVADDDTDPDPDSVLGFEDDARVLNAVLRFLGRADLLIELP